MTLIPNKSLTNRWRDAVAAGETLHGRDDWVALNELHVLDVIPHAEHLLLAAIDQPVDIQVCPKVTARLSSYKAADTLQLRRSRYSYLSLQDTTDYRHLAGTVASKGKPVESRRYAPLVGTMSTADLSPDTVRQLLHETLPLLQHELVIRACRESPTAYQPEPDPSDTFSDVIHALHTDFHRLRKADILYSIDWPRVPCSIVLSAGVSPAGFKSSRYQLHVTGKDRYGRTITAQARKPAIHRRGMWTLDIVADEAQRAVKQLLQSKSIISSNLKKATARMFNYTAAPATKPIDRIEK